MSFFVFVLALNRQGAIHPVFCDRISVLILVSRTSGLTVQTVFSYQCDDHIGMGDIDTVELCDIHGNVHVVQSDCRGHSRLCHQMILCRGPGDPVSLFVQGIVHRSAVQSGSFRSDDDISFADIQPGLSVFGLLNI